MRNTSLWIAAGVAVACGCNSKQPAETKQDQPGTFTCKHVQNERAVDTDAACVDSTDQFDAVAPVVHMTYRTVDVPKSGDTYAIQWIATDLGSAAPPDMLIATLNKPVGDVLDGATSYTLNSHMTKPTNGWPVGKYRVEVKLGDKLVTTAKFSIK